MINFLKRHGLLHALLAAVCLIGVFPPWDQGWLAGAALVPLLVFCRDRRPGSSFTMGLVFGLISHVGIYIWIFRIPGFKLYHALPLILYFSLYPACWCAGLSLWRRQNHSVILVLAPALWVALNYIKDHAGFLAFPWAELAVSQHACLPLLQIASLGGAASVTFILVLTNTALAESLLARCLKPLLPVLLILAVIFAWGNRQLQATPKPTSRLRVAVVQPALRLSERKSDSGRATGRARLENLSIKAAKAGAQLVVWPETALRGLSSDPQLQLWLRQLLQQTGIQLFLGTSDFFKFGYQALPETGQGKIIYRAHNSACFFRDEKADCEPYHKMILVPFGEYLPDSTVFHWPEWLVPEFTESCAGDRFVSFTLADGQRLVPVICWENLFGDFVRRFVKTEKAGYIVNISNDNWFAPVAAEQHNLASVLRAVENRRPVILASNTGPSEIIDAYGRVKAETKKNFTPALIIDTIQPGSGQTWYARYGNFFAWGCLLLGGAGMLNSFIEWLAYANQKAER